MSWNFSDIHENQALKVGIILFYCVILISQVKSYEPSGPLLPELILGSVA